MRGAIALIVVVSACASEEPADDHRHGTRDHRSGAGVELPDEPTAEDLLARVAGCDMVVGGPYADGSGQPANRSMCGFPGAVVWTADMDIDCDGKESEQCNLDTDPWFMNQTAASDSMGDPLDSATLPFVVVPGKSTRFDYRMAGLAMGTVVAVIYDGKLEYGPLGDVGPTAYIGEASYRMAELLGIDPDPHYGGSDGPVTYIAFTGMEAKLETIEDHDEAVAVGIERAEALLSAN